jgi:hypothetical protein
VHAATHNQSYDGSAIIHTKTLQGAHKKAGIVKVRNVRSNASDVREIRSRQAGTTIKRDTVNRNGVRAQTVRVTFVSSRKHNKKKSTDIAMKQTTQSVDANNRLMQAMIHVVDRLRALVGARRNAQPIV